MRIVKTLLAVLAAPFAMASAMAVMPPEQAIDVDMRYLSPPQIIPQTGQSVAEQIEGGMRLSGRASADGNSFVWPVRYAIQVRNYPIIDIQYRAQNLFAHPRAGNTLLQMTMLSASGQITPAIIVDTSELIQDGAVHEIRKDLGRYAADNVITEISFTFNTPESGGMLELSGLRFEQGPTSPAPFLLPRENVDFVVTDANGFPMADAEVHAGLIERSNWTTVGRTDARGRLTVQVIRPVRPDGTYVDPVEAMVIKPGYVPQYVAPIEFPRSGPVEVKLTVAPVAPQVQAPIGEEPEGTYYYVPDRERVVYYDAYPSVVYVQTYAYPWWIPPYYCGYRPYYHRDYFYYHHRAGFRYDWDREHRDRWYDGSRSDWHRDDWDRNVWRRPGISPVPDPREIARRQINRDISRGNDPGTGTEHSEIWRRTVVNPPAGLTGPIEDRGARYRRDRQENIIRGNEPSSGERDSEEFRRRVAPTPPVPQPTSPAPQDRGERYRRTDVSAPRISSPPTPTPAPTPDRSNRRRDGNEARGNDPGVAAPVPAPTPRTPVQDRGDRSRGDQVRRIDSPAPARPSPPPAPAPAPAPDRGSRDRDRQNDPDAGGPGQDRGERYRRERAQVGTPPAAPLAPPVAAPTPAPKPVAEARPNREASATPVAPRRVDPPVSPRSEIARPAAPESPRRVDPATVARRPAPAPSVPTRIEVPAPRPAAAPEPRRVEIPAPRPAAAAEPRRIEVPAARPSDSGDSRGNEPDRLHDRPGRRR